MEKRRHSELRTQRKRYSMERLIFSVLLLSAVQHSVLADTRRSTATGSRNRLRQKLEEMCTLSYDTLYGRMTNNPRIFHGWVEELGPLTKTQRRDRYFYDRPVDSKFSFIFAQTSYNSNVYFLSFSAPKLYLPANEHYVLQSQDGKAHRTASPEGVRGAAS